MLDELQAGRLGARFNVRIGRLSSDETFVIRTRFGTSGRVELTGDLSQSELDESYERAAVVVRRLAHGRERANWAAASGPIVSALAAGCAVISNDNRGSARCVAAAGVDLSSQPGRSARSCSGWPPIQSTGSGCSELLVRTLRPFTLRQPLRSAWHTSGAARAHMS